MEFKFSHFINRMGMYFWPIEKETIVAFVHGYHIGNDESNLLSDLKAQLTDKYGIPEKATGWPGQIEQFSKSRECSWVEGFTVLVNELIEDGKLE